MTEKETDTGVAWTLHNSTVTAAIVGGRNAKQVEGVIPAMNFCLPRSRVH